MRVRLSAMVMIGLYGAAPAAAAELTPPVAGVLDFSIIRKGDVIGHYHSDFIDRPDHALEVRTHVTAEVTLGPIRLYSLEHRSVETWRNGRLDGLVTDTEEDGEVRHLRAERVDQSLVLTVDGKVSETTADAVPSSLWSRSMLDGNRPIFDIGDGQLFHVTTHCDAPAESPSLCQLSGDLIRSLRYDSKGVLVGLSFPAEDGSTVIYR